jgi:hypothetical protein
MTITYHAGRRIQGLSTDTFTSFDYIFPDTNNWTSGDSFTDLTISSNTIGGTIDRIANSGAVFDLANATYGYGSNISDSAFNIRFKLVTGSNTTPSSDKIKFFIGLTETGDTSYSGRTAGDSIGFTFHNDNDGSRRVYITYSDESTSLEGNQVRTAVDYSASTTYYVELKRNGATITVNFYPTSAYSGTPTITQNTTMTGTIADLRYFAVGCNYYTGSGAGSTAITISELDIYDASSTPITRPTNVQSGSRFEETDTRKIYYGALGDDNSSADLNEDFTGSSSTHSGDNTTVAGWLSSDASEIYYDGSNDWLYWNISRGTNDSISYDLGAGNVSDTAWILRFNVQWDAFVSNAFNEQRWGISDQSSATAHNGTHKFIGCMTQFWDSVSRTLTPSSANSSSIGINSGGWTYDWDGVLGTNTYVYIEIKRINSTQYTISASSTDAYTGDLSTSGNLTCPNVTGLRYIWFGNENAGSDDATMNSKTNEVKFWNGVTSVPQTIQWTEEV